MLTLPAVPTLPALRTVLSGLCLALASLPGLAWGPLGHRTVGGIADALIAGTPTAKQVRSILGGNLQMASVWADCARAVESTGDMAHIRWAYTHAGTYKDCAIYENTASQAAMIDFVKRNASRCGGFASHAQCRHKAWHFTDIPLQTQAYVPGQVGTAPNDLVQAVQAAITVLQGGTPAAAFNYGGQSAALRKREAMRLLVHFVGDLHQPLHVASLYLDPQGQALLPVDDAQAKASSNAGGNGILVGKTKLHALWDDVPGKIAFKLLPADGKGPGAGATAARLLPPSTGALDTWPTAWANDTIGHAGPVFQGLHIGARVGDAWPATSTEPAYRQARDTLQQAQLIQAGARLAQLLTTLFP